MCLKDHPRWCGEHKTEDTEPYEIQGSPPLARGAPIGNQEKKFAFWDHPRWRGEHSLCNEFRLLTKGSPPLARGAPIGGNMSFKNFGITPAGAGSTRGWLDDAQKKWDHPRWRGEHCHHVYRDLYEAGSPPLARGARLLTRYKPLKHGITPAGAGSTIEPVFCYRRARDHPRWRGEHSVA